jgi:hypothetical protein
MGVHGEGAGIGQILNGECKLPLILQQLAPAHVIIAGGLQEYGLAVVADGFVVFALEDVGFAAADDVRLVERIDLDLLAQPANFVLLHLHLPFHLFN